MSAGLQIWNDHGSVQIDQNYFNMVLITNGYAGTAYTQVAPDDGVNGTGYTWMTSISYTGSNPVIFIDTKGYNCAHYRTRQNGNTFTFYIATFDGNGNSVQGTIAYYIYDIVPNIQATSRGLTVWNASGQVVFNSDYEPMRLINFGSSGSGFTQVVDNTGGAIGSGAGIHIYPPGSTTLYSSGQKIAISFTPPKAFYKTAHQGLYQNYIQTFQTNNNNNPPYMTTDGGGENGAGSATPYGIMGSGNFRLQAPYGGQIMMVDVTNHYI